MARKTNQKFQNDAARRELEAGGVSEITIQALERGWGEHTARQGRARDDERSYRSLYRLER